MESTDYNRRAARALKAMRESKGIKSARAFAQFITNQLGDGPSDSSYRRYEDGHQDIPAWVLIAAAEATGMSLDGLLEQPEPQGLWFDRVTRELQEVRAQLDEIRKKTAAEA